MMRMVNNGVMMSDQEALVPLVETVIHHRGAQGSSHARARTPNTRIMPCAAGLALLVSSALLALSAAGALLGIPPFSFFHSLISLLLAMAWGRRIRLHKLRGISRRRWFLMLC